MAVVIMFGLGFASILTLVVVPVLYAIFFKVKTSEQAV
jgi:multidrug efflux pump subunit AcrB